MLNACQWPNQQTVQKLVERTKQAGKKENKRKQKYSLNFHHSYPFKIPVGFDKLSNPGNSNLGELPKCFIFKRNV